jgi:rubrerythrin
MKTTNEVKEILEKALNWEKSAEKNCDMILRILTTNGLHDSIDHIRNDEIHHQEMVKRLIKFLD